MSRRIGLIGGAVVSLAACIVVAPGSIDAQVSSDTQLHAPERPSDNEYRPHTRPSSHLRAAQTADAFNIGLTGLGLALLRFDMDVTWSHIESDLSRGRTAIVELSLRPFLDWDDDWDCTITVDLIEQLGTPFRFLALVSELQAHGVVIGEACFPPEIREAMTQIGLTDLRIDHATLSFDYVLATSSLDLSARLHVAELGAASVEMALDYVWVEGGPLSLDPTAPPEPIAVVSLEVV